jgi:Cu+-exporting ATPase
LHQANKNCHDMRETAPAPTREKEICAHCGDDCPPHPVCADAKVFCCAGCKSVYELLYANNLCTYYNFDAGAKPGVTVKEEEVPLGRFAYLDEDPIRNQLLNFQSEAIHKVLFRIPGMHCSSCIWLLENLHKLDQGVIESRVNFPRREVTITYHPGKTRLSAVVTLLHKIGYGPTLNLATLSDQKKAGRSGGLTLQLGLAGFCFGNIMLLSFPEYLALGSEIQELFGSFLGLLSLALALPVLVYSARGFFLSAGRSLKQGHINLDTPISLGLLSLFCVSLYDIGTASGPGYLDSFTGLVFFMLIGKYVQQSTYEALAFDRDYKAYFPISVTVVKKGVEETMAVQQLVPGHRLRIRNQELVPADALLLRGQALIDYSFVSGESVPVPKGVGEMIYAGGRQVGESIELEVLKEVSQSYLTQLWNNDIFHKDKSYFGLGTYADKVGRYFIAVTLLIALGALGYWMPRDPAMALKAFTSVLVIACPCALSLSTPFTLSYALRILGRHKFYLKNGDVAETLAKASVVVFDKTGTLTESARTDISYRGPSLDLQEQSLLRSVLQHSTHPLSQSLYGFLQGPVRPVTDYREVAGQGVAGRADGVGIRAGTAGFTGLSTGTSGAARASQVYVQVGGQTGVFTFSNHYRPGLASLLAQLRRQGKKLAVLSGDNDAERENLRALFGEEAGLHFAQSPADKLAFIAGLKARGECVVMVGDGLNDAGALQMSDAGIAVTSSVNGFAPGCDAILDANAFTLLATFLRFARHSLYVILGAFGISFVYNLLGLSLAVTGQFSPVVSAILMPLSSLSVILCSVLGVRLVAWRLGLLDSAASKPDTL